jgi:hypothetical protein
MSARVHFVESAGADQVAPPPYGARVPVDGERPDTDSAFGESGKLTLGVPIPLQS